MRKSLLSTLAILGTTVLSFSQATNYPNGSLVDNFIVVDIDGNKHNLYKITASGKYVMLDFFFASCPGCQESLTYFHEINDRFGCNEGDIYLISISNGTDNDAAIKAFRSLYGGPWKDAPIVGTNGYSEDITFRFGVGAWPTYCIIGPDNVMLENDIWPVQDATTFEEALTTVQAYPTIFPCSPPETAEEALAHELSMILYSQYPEEEVTIDEADAENNPASKAAGGYTITEKQLGSVLLFPNPAQNDLNIAFEAAASTEAIIEVYNVMGELVYSKNTETTPGTNYERIDVSAMTPGHYLIRIAIKDEITSLKFIKQ